MQMSICSYLAYFLATHTYFLKDQRMLCAVEARKMTKRFSNEARIHFFCHFLYFLSAVLKKQNLKLLNMPWHCTFLAFLKHL